MTRYGRLLQACCLVGLLCAAPSSVPRSAARQPEADFKADDLVQTVRVRIDVGAGGADLDEPVALDLGLGFPFWLHPVGRQPKEAPPFGAVPQEANAQAKIAAGSSATFTFSLQAEPGQDAFRTSAQLLDGVRLSNISRVGFASKGKSAWVLAGYEVQINGKVFASKTAGEAAKVSAENKQKLEELDKKIVPLQTELADLQALVQANLATTEDLKRQKDVEAALKALLDEKSRLATQGQVGVQAQATQDAARARLAELNAKIAPLQSQWSDGRTLAQTQLDEEADRKQLADVEKALTPLLREKVWLEGQLQGKYPWFEDKAFKSPWREGDPVRSVKVTLVTQNHPGAGTQNYVYFGTGGHKYLCGSPARPMQAGALQVFRLDLLGGPLTQPELGNWAVGMLAQPQPFGAAPDRWHPARLLVEVDGKIVYDSEEVASDRQSLAAIRVIPPAHKGQDDGLVTNTPNARETFVWEAGKGLGVDADTGQANDLPATDDPNYPKAEPGLPDLPSPTPADQAAGEDQPGCFPGEQPPPPEEGLPPDVVPPVIIIIEDGGGIWPPPPDGWPPDWPPPDGLPWPPPDGGGNTPQPANPPFQVENVRITDGWRTGGPFTIQWSVSGDESQIDHFEVALGHIRPSDPQPIGTHFRVGGNVPRGTHTITGVPTNIASIAQNDDVFLAPYVVAVPADPIAYTPHEKHGPARATSPPATDPGVQATLAPVCQRFPPGPLPFMVSAAEPPAPERGVWPAGQVLSHLGLEFESIATGWNVGARPAPADGWIRLNLEQGPNFVFTGTRELVFHLGFLGGDGASNNVTAVFQARIFDPVAATIHVYPAQIKPLTTPEGGGNAPMVVFRQTISTSDLAGPALFPRVRAWVRFQGGAGDPTHAPALFGVRIVPGP